MRFGCLGLTQETQQDQLLLSAFAPTGAPLLAGSADAKEKLGPRLSFPLISGRIQSEVGPTNVSAVYHHLEHRIRAVSFNLEAPVKSARHVLEYPTRIVRSSPAVAQKSVSHARFG